MCGCQQRRDRLNQWSPGLGDKVAVVAEPIKEGYEKVMKNLLKPDAVAVLGFATGAFVLPWLLAQVQRRA